MARRTLLDLHYERDVWQARDVRNSFNITLGGWVDAAYDARLTTRTASSARSFAARRRLESLGRRTT
jgi:hypothetical protein